MKNLEAIKGILPHRYPFLMIDRVLEVEAGTYCKALKNITANEEVFQGHFPQQAVFPGGPASEGSLGGESSTTYAAALAR